MRIWSLHPKYLDSKGLVALWREALLAKHVLEGKTVGYKNHPQLERFKKSPNPLDAINRYLEEVLAEASNRNYNFDPAKITHGLKPSPIKVSDGQVEYEWEHLLRKLKTRDPQKHAELKNKTIHESHPLFLMIDGAVEDWEKQ